MRDARLGSLARDPRGWLVIIAVGTVFAAQAMVIASGDGEVGRRGLVLSLVCSLLIGSFAAAALARRQFVAAGATLAIVSPGVLNEVVAGSLAAALAVVAAVAVLSILTTRRLEPETALAGSVVGALALLIWWFATTGERAGLVPTWGRIVAETGQTLRTAAAGATRSADAAAAVGDVPMMIWVIAVGVVVGAAVVAGRRRAAAVVPAAFVVFVGASWAIARWRGDLDPMGGMWILTTAVAVTGAAARPLARTADRRIGSVIAAVVALAWTTGLVQQARRLDASSLVTAFGVLAPTLVVLAVVTFARRAPGSSGVNVIGYFDVTSGLGERARTLVEVLRAGGVPVSEWPVTSSPSPERHEPGTGPALADRPIYGTTIAVVTALEFGGLDASHHELLRDVDRVIGYWFWELDVVPDSHRQALSMVDEVWAPTRFVRDAYRPATHKPVRLVALPIAPPIVEAAGNDAVDPFDRNGDTVFLVSFDHLSVMQRKNPIGAIEAFGRAFPVGDEPVRLVIKTINADRQPGSASDLTTAARDHRIRIWDEHLPASAQATLVAAADAYVSLHRSEGLGLLPAEAMWLGTPVIASAYSGTLDVMNEETALLVPVDSVAVVDGGGAYPPDATWGDPDLDVAAEAMRLVVDERDTVRSIADAAHERMSRQTSTDAAGRAVRRVLTGWASEVAAWSPTEDGRVDSVAPMDTTTAHASSQRS